MNSNEGCRRLGSYRVNCDNPRGAKLELVDDGSEPNPVIVEIGNGCFRNAGLDAGAGTMVIDHVDAMEAPQGQEYAAMLKVAVPWGMLDVSGGSFTVSAHIGDNDVATKLAVDEDEVGRTLAIKLLQKGGGIQVDIQGPWSWCAESRDPPGDSPPVPGDPPGDSPPVPGDPPGDSPPVPGDPPGDSPPVPGDPPGDSPPGTRDPPGDSPPGTRDPPGDSPPGTRDPPGDSPPVPGDPPGDSPPVPGDPPGDSPPVPGDPPGDSPPGTRDPPGDSPPGTRDPPGDSPPVPGDPHGDSPPGTRDPPGDSPPVPGDPPGDSPPVPGDPPGDSPPVPGDPPGDSPPGTRDPPPPPPPVVRIDVPPCYGKIEIPGRLKGMSCTIKGGCVTSIKPVNHRVIITLDKTSPKPGHIYLDRGILNVGFPRRVFDSRRSDVDVPFSVFNGDTPVYLIDSGDPAGSNRFLEDNGPSFRKLKIGFAQSKRPITITITGTHLKPPPVIRPHTPITRAGTSMTAGRSTTPQPRRLTLCSE